MDLSEALGPDEPSRDQIKDGRTDQGQHQGDASHDVKEKGPEYQDEKKDGESSQVPAQDLAR